MKIAIYVLCYNEEAMLPFFFQHYRSLVDRIIVNDNQSTDDSPSLAKSLGADEVRTFSTENQIRDDLTRRLRNECWKELKGKGFDWVFVIDMDEFIYHPALISYLAQKKEEGVTVVRPYGYQMVGDEFPSYDRSILEQICNGRPDRLFSKPVIFNPDHIEDMNFNPGSHNAKPTGNVQISYDGEIKLLHYSWLSLDWILSKHKRSAARLSEINVEKGWGREYTNSTPKVRKDYRNLKKWSFDVFKHVVGKGDLIGRRQSRKKKK